MTKRLKLTGLIGGILLGASVLAAEAAPIQGGFSITGNFLPVLGATGASTSLDLATGLDFIQLFGSTATPGVAGAFLVNSASGDFLTVGLVGSVGTIRDFTFSGAGSVNFPTAPTLLSFQAVGGLTFDLLSAAVGFQMVGVPALILSGTGIFNMPGYQATFGTFTMTANGAQNTFTFSSSQGATTAVPEPASLLVLAAGLLGAGGYLRRRTTNRAA